MDIQSAINRAATLARLGYGRTAPNPIVGAVIISSTGEILGEGFHNKAVSDDHAEVVAIKSAQGSVKGATMVVTLEPCSHTGTTPPCTSAIIDAGITQVIYLTSDPTPAGGGAEILRSAGIDVNFDQSRSEIAFDNRQWLHKVRTGSPWMVWKIASTLDGKIAAPDKSSKWITSVGARADVALLRRQSDAIMVGTQTVIVDNPTLVPVGEFEGYGENPLRIICGVQELDPASNIFNNLAKTLVIASKDLDLLQSKLAELPINQVLVEAGPTFGTALLKAGLINEVILYQAPTVLGAGKSSIADFGAENISDRIDLELISSEVTDGNIKSRFLTKAMVG